ncbi:hypothetical protein E2C01_099402 [Portunus trituberculatus]|uniref:Uncharacterized protein n=1 Tax=Portunus trituberculatus TaxID=210409 RepID=A0A5B7K3R1_PORTR|nr:hypothetical protein [Portunus trituberculatus]
MRSVTVKRKEGRGVICRVGRLSSYQEEEEEEELEEKRAVAAERRKASQCWCRLRVAKSCVPCRVSEGCRRAACYEGEKRGPR